jgi:hypothetical protein
VPIWRRARSPPFIGPRGGEGRLRRWEWWGSGGGAIDGGGAGGGSVSGRGGREAVAPVHCALMRSSVEGGEAAR